MGIKHLREEKGSGLVLTLMVLLVLSVLGISIGTLTLGSNRLSDANRDDTSAYYIAEAGAVAAYEEIQSKVLVVYKSSKTADEFYGSIKSLVSGQAGASPVKFDPQFGSTPTATIKTAQQDSTTYIISSTGEVDGKKRTVTKEFTVNWVGKNTGGSGGLPTLPDKTALLVNEKMNLLGGTLKGNAYIQSIINDAVQMGTYGSFKESTLHYSSQTTSDNLINYQDWFKDKLPNLSTEMKNIDFNEYQKVLANITAPNITKKLPEQTIMGYTVQDANGNVKITDSKANNFILELDSDVYIPEMISSSNFSFSIDTNGKNRTILVDKMEIVSQNLNITGGGTLTIVVTDKLNISSLPNFNSDDEKDPVNLIFLGKAPVVLSGWKDANINAHIIIKEAKVFANTTKINGILLTGGDEVELSGGISGSNMMLIAPKAAVSVIGSYSINGTVIAKTFKLEGGRASLKYAAINTTGFPFGSTAPAADPEPEAIISSEPIIEN